MSLTEDLKLYSPVCLPFFHMDSRLLSVPQFSLLWKG